jgi:class 3 adenylate cyclase
MIRRFFRIIFSEESVIPWMLVVSLIPMIMITVISYGIARKIFDETAHNLLTLSINKKVEMIDNYITERKLDAGQISSLPELVAIINKSEVNGKLESIDLKTMQPITNYLSNFARKTELRNFYILNMDGKIIYSMQGNLEELISNPLMDKAFSNAFQGAKFLRMPYLSNYNLTNTAADSGILIATPIFAQGLTGPTKAILISELGADVLQNLVSSYLSFGALLVQQTILGTDVDGKTGIFLYSVNSKNQNVEVTNPSILRFLQKGLQGNVGLPLDYTINGVPLIIVYSYVPQLNMAMLLEYNKKDLYRQTRWLKLNILIVSLVGLLLVITTVYFIARKIRQANLRSERLLENILPKFVITELKEKKQFLARNVKSTSIMFADIVNFTNYASVTSPEKVVHLLDYFFSIFDNLCSQFQMEKIKTIGDAYMAVSGLFGEDRYHANHAVDMGLEMIRAIEHFNLDHDTHFALRVGVDSGDVTTGIIGKQKFSYDLWGHAVNRASRMESTGVENIVQITQKTYEALIDKEKYSAVARHDVDIKGLGKMDTYLINLKPTATNF